MPRRAPKGPVPDGYVCKACSEPGHWVFDCAKRTKKRQAEDELDKEKAAPEKADEESEEEGFKIKPKADTTFRKKKPFAASAVAKPAPVAPGMVKLFREPTAEDIRKAKEIMPVINPKLAPKCDCGEAARARKCKKKESKAFGHMFWWCPKAKDDETRCKFARKADVI